MARLNKSAGMLLALAELHGVGSEVAALLQESDTCQPQTLGELLQDSRKASGQPLSVIMQRSNIARSQLHRIEQELGKNGPGIRTLQALAYGYRLPFIKVLLAALQSQK